LSRSVTWGASEDVAADYRAMLPRIVGDPETLAWALEYQSIHAGRCDWDAKFLAEFISSTGRVLNVGGAPFLFEYAFRRRAPGAALFSLDLSPERFLDLEDAMGVQVRAIDIEQANASALAEVGTFDCVVFCEVFEHLRFNLLGAVRNLWTLTSPGGALYLTMPNGESLAALRRLLIGRRSGPDVIAEWGKLETLGHMGHVREYTAREGNEVVETCGFIVERQFYRSGRRADPVRSLVKSALDRLAPRLADEVVIVARKP
jgi:SAM-dependent methyltransferase